MYYRLKSLLEQYNILYDLQYGFRKKTSTEHTLWDIINEIETNIGGELYSCGTVFRLSTLVVVNGLWESKSHDKVIVLFISSSFGGLVTGSIRLGKYRVVVHDYKDIMTSSRALFKMNIIHGDKLKRSFGNDRLKWCIDVGHGLPLFQAEHFCDIMCNVPFHDWAVKALSCRLYYFVCALMSHVFMQFNVHPFVTFLEQHHSIPRFDPHL